MKPNKGHGFGRHLEGERSLRPPGGVPAMDVHDALELDDGEPVSVTLRGEVHPIRDRVSNWNGERWMVVQLKERWCLVPAPVAKKEQ